jgi:hypothetical protein
MSGAQIPPHAYAARIRRATVFSLLFVVLIATADTSSGADSLRLAVNPKFAHTPGTFRAVAIVERNAENRWLVLCAESADYYRSSTIQLNGGQAARRHEMFFERLPAGRYLIQARLERADGELIIRDSVVVVGTTSGRR